MMEEITYYDQYRRYITELCAFEAGKYDIHLTDFTFIHNNNKYSIIICKKGDGGQWYRIKHKNVSYISNNVWIARSDNDNSEYEVSKIERSEIKDNDIKLDNLGFVKNKQVVIDYYLNAIDEENIKEQIDNLKKNTFWENKKILIFVMDDGFEFFACILKVGNDLDEIKYYLLISHEPLISNMHNTFKHHIHAEDDDLDNLTDKLLERLNDDLASPLEVTIASKCIYNKIKKKFNESYSISEFKKKKLIDYYAKEMNHEFYINLDDDKDCNGFYKDSNYF
jgi:hypothetical protein